MNKPFVKSGYLGILLVIISIVLIGVNPSKAKKLPQGFVTPVVAFEFIRTEAEVFDLFGHDQSEDQIRIINSMKLGTYIDFLYISAYTIFLIIFTAVIGRITGSKWFLFSGFIVMCISLSDIGENIQLLSIMEKLESIAKLAGGGFGRELILLNFFTWAKWGGLTALFISYIPFLRNSGRFGRIISVTALLSALAGTAAFLNRSVVNEIYVLSIAAVFLMLFIFSFTYSRGNHVDL